MATLSQQTHHDLGDHRIILDKQQPARRIGPLQRARYPAQASLACACVEGKTHRKDGACTDAVGDTDTSAHERAQFVTDGQTESGSLGTLWRAALFETREQSSPQ